MACDTFDADEYADSGGGDGVVDGDFPPVEVVEKRLVIRSFIAAIFWCNAARFGETFNG